MFILAIPSAPFHKSNLGVTATLLLDNVGDELDNTGNELDSESVKELLTFWAKALSSSVTPAILPDSEHAAKASRPTNAISST
ncbi:hypothetical protein [Fibrobacter sp. UBA4309]|uniref:hypothetical protein n=1 Tax=Fibrobacter sp. UBA4309 TaxID=1946537 RepID=UPI0025BFF325|nr:hypothetical protein [Fibrobacter sp. UBA4309]